MSRASKWVSNKECVSKRKNEVLAIWFIKCDISLRKLCTMLSKYVNKYGESLCKRRNMHTPNNNWARRKMCEKWATALKHTINFRSLACWYVVIAYPFWTSPTMYLRRIKCEAWIFRWCAFVFMSFIFSQSTADARTILESVWALCLLEFPWNAIYTCTINTQF